MSALALLGAEPGGRKGAGAAWAWLKLANAEARYIERRRRADCAGCAARRGRLAHRYYREVESPA